MSSDALKTLQPPLPASPPTQPQPPTPQLPRRQSPPGKLPPSAEEKSESGSEYEASDGEPSAEEKSESGSEYESSDGEPSAEEKSESGSEYEASDGEPMKVGTLDPLPFPPPPGKGCVIVTREDLANTVYDAEKTWISPMFPDEEVGDIACWQKYFQQIDESEGFDIKDYPGCGPLTTIFPAPILEHTNGYAAQALAIYNKRRASKFEFNEILKVNAEACQNYTYYITFTATNANGDKEYFQAKVVRRIDQSLKFPIVRLRVKGGLDIYCMDVEVCTILPWVQALALC